MDMSDRFFDSPILNSPYHIPAQHWELDESGQPTNRILDRRRQVSFITPIPKPKKRKGAQQALIFEGGAGETCKKLLADGVLVQVFAVR